MSWKKSFKNNKYLLENLLAQIKDCTMSKADFYVLMSDRLFTYTLDGVSIFPAAWETYDAQKKYKIWIPATLPVQENGKKTNVKVHGKTWFISLLLNGKFMMMKKILDHNFVIRDEAKLDKVLHDILMMTWLTAKEVVEKNY